MTDDRTRMVPIDKITVKTFARHHLDDDWVATLMDLIKAGQDLPPIEVTEDDLDTVDGRHRLQAYRLLGYETLKVRLVPAMTRLEKQTAAMRANIGGALPPRLRDYYSTFMQMLEDGASPKQIRDQFPELPKRLLSDLTRHAASNRRRFQVAKAADLFANENMTIRQAAAKTGVDVEELKALIQRRKQAYPVLQQLEADLNHAFRSTSRITSTIMAKARTLYEDGLLSRDEALRVTTRARDGYKRGVKTSEQHRQRMLTDQELEAAPLEAEPDTQGQRTQ